MNLRPFTGHGRRARHRPRPLPAALALPALALALGLAAGGAPGAAAAPMTAAAPMAAAAPMTAAAPMAGTAAAPTAGAGGAPVASAANPGQPRTAASPDCPWLDQSLPVAQRVQLLMSRMTLDNEIKVVEGQGTSQPYVFYMAAQPDLCIPAMGLEDGPGGVGDGLTGVTQLPAGVSLAATFDPSLARQYGAVIGAEEWGKGASVNLGPTVNIDRDPRWGRSFEAFTEDPFLNAALATSEISGVQSQGEMSQVKHFAAYNQETNRNSTADDVIVSGRALHEIYFPAFEAAVTRAKVASVMCGYAVVNGDFDCQSPFLENQTLRQEWHFPGFVTSDYAAIHDTEAAVDGTDMEQPFSNFFGQSLEQAVENGTIAKSVVDTMVSRIMTEMFRFGLFNHPPTGNTAATVTTPAHQALATQVAEDGTVLLKNSRGVLPLPAGHAGTVAVIGPAASTATVDAGGGSAYVTPPFSVSPLQGLTAAAGPGTHIVYQQGLPADTSLAAVPATALSPPYAPTGFGGSGYTGTLTAPETGTYVLALTNPCGCYGAATLAVDGHVVITDPSTPPVHTYSAAVDLTAGQAYTIHINGASSAFTWARPSDLAPGIAQAAAAARSAATAVVVVSDDTETEAADRTSLSLPSAQDELIEAVAAANPRTVVVVNAGAPVTMPWLGQAAAVVDAWYPGESNGTALASVLYGGTDPSGRLPVTFPRDLSQVPAATAAQFPGVNGQVQYSEGINVGYRWYDSQQETPLFPFGYGLSYTRFRFSDLHVDAGAGHGNGSRGGHGLVRVTARVTNTGRLAGSGVAQLYLADPAATGEPPRQLKGFQKVPLAPGQSAVVSFRLSERDLSYWSDTQSQWVLPSGRFGVYVGDSSALAGLPLRGGFTVTGHAGHR